MGRETLSMTLHYCEAEKSAAICAEIVRGVTDLQAGSLTLLHLCTFSLFCSTVNQYRMLLDL